MFFKKKVSLIYKTQCLVIENKGRAMYYSKNKVFIVSFSSYAFDILFDIL